jgi:uncharacterized RDD family membrane protein YckC
VHCGQRNTVPDNDSLKTPICTGCGASLDVTYQPSSPTLPGEYAGFWVRFRAEIVDCWIIFWAIIILLIPIFLSPNWDAGVLAIIFYGFLLIWPLYHWLLTGLRGQTFGKMVFHIVVVNDQGGKVGLTRAFLREVLGKLLSGVGLWIGFFWIIGDRNKQGWHDKIAGTYVVRIKK